MKDCHDFHPTAFSWTCIWAQCLAAFIASTTASPSSLATDPLASFTATVTLVVYGDHGAPLRVHNRTLEGCVFADGYHVRSQRVLDEGTYLYASALLTNTVYSLITASSPSGSTRYQAYLERGLVSRFFPEGPPGCRPGAQYRRSLATRRRGYDQDSAKSGRTHPGILQPLFRGPISVAPQNHRAGSSSPFCLVQHGDYAASQALRLRLYILDPGRFL